MNWQSDVAVVYSKYEIDVIYFEILKRVSENWVMEK